MSFAFAPLLLDLPLLLPALLLESFELLLRRQERRLALLEEALQIRHLERDLLLLLVETARLAHDLLQIDQDLHLLHQGFSPPPLPPRGAPPQGFFFHDDMGRHGPRKPRCDDPPEFRQDPPLPRGMPDVRHRHIPRRGLERLVVLHVPRDIEVRSRFTRGGGELRPAPPAPRAPPARLPAGGRP